MAPLLEAGALRKFPDSNTVLNSRSGYRDVYRAFLVGEVAASLTWLGGQDVFGAGKRDAATLYEYWVFFELIRAIERVPGFLLDKRELVAATEEGLGLRLARGRSLMIGGHGVRRGRRVKLELWFNKGFGRSDNRGATWGATVRPDCSLRISPETGDGWKTDTWLHFDAKYRVDKNEANDNVGDDEANPAQSTEPSIGRPNNDDLRKMHSYRDAIRRSAGAFVLYPGADADIEAPYRQYHEVLPGVGAFVLRPMVDGTSSDQATDALVAFLDDAIDHVAAQGTSRERAQYWEDVAHSAGSGERRLRYTPTLTRPPDDASVLLGFVRSEQHWQWIRTSHLYNLRADPTRRGSVAIDSPAVRSDLVVLYDADQESTLAFRLTGALYIRSGEELRAGGYPGARDSTMGTGSMYLCLELGQEVDLGVSGAVARRLARADGSPTLTTWAALAFENSDQRK